MIRSGSVGIVGVGLIGASIGLRARAGGRWVVGFDVSSAHLAQAQSLGAIDVAAAGMRELVQACETLVLALPIEQTVAAIEALRAAPPPAELVIDVASVKGTIVAAAAGLDSFVGTHPIAGSERSGPQAADPDLFVGRAWAYVPAAALLDRRAVEFIEGMGAYAVPVEAVEHDRLVAATSHLPQMLSVALGTHVAATLQHEPALALSGTGLRSMTRLGASAWSVWRGILTSNGPNVAQEVRLMASILASVADEIAAGDLAALDRRFAQAAYVDAQLRANDSGVPRVP